MSTTEQRSRALNRDISRAMVALFKESTGRGPNRARTYVEDGIVVTVLYDTMTKAEKTLKEEHKEDTVRSLRRIFQGTFRDDAIEIVERLTGRKVVAFLSDHAVEPDYAIEAFVLEPGLGDEAD
ncbi:MAG TPA: Na-translocating system protein MpsC family protein [Solirubrobacterales bacterium]|nr:Na-translocating system protein MpsC family protein [Solirubrobacterales bacterium]